MECKPRGIFRKQKITPVAGDEVTLETENGAAVIAEIAPRKKCSCGLRWQIWMCCFCGQHHPAHAQHAGAG